MDNLTGSLNNEDSEFYWEHDSLEERTLEEYERFPENINTLEEFDEWLAQ